MLSSIWGFFVIVTYFVVSIIFWPPLLLLPVAITIIVVIYTVLTSWNSEDGKLTRGQQEVLKELTQMGFTEGEAITAIRNTPEAKTPQETKQRVLRNIIR